MQPPPRLDLGNPQQPQQQTPPHFPPPPSYREEPPAPPAKSKLARILPSLVTLGAFGGLAVLAWFAYQEGKNPASEEEVPVVKADKEPFKRPPENPGGEEIPNADKEVYNSFSGDKGKQEAKKAKALPDEERPIDRAFLKQFTGTGEDDAAPAKQEAIAFGENKNADAPLEAKPLPLAKANEAIPTPNTGGVEVVKKAPVVPTLTDTKPAAAEAKKEEKPVAQPEAVKKAEVVKEKKVKKLLEKKEAAAPQKTAAKKPAKTEKAVKAEKPVKATGVRVQLGAYTSDAEANREWKKIHTKHKALFAGAKMVVQKAEVSGKTMYRLQIGDLKSKEAAKALCKKLATSKQGCFIVK